MSLIGQQIFVTPGQVFDGIGSGGGGGGGSFSTINVSTIDMAANSDINWDGSLNFQGTNGGYVSILSSISGDNSANGIVITGASPNDASTINMYIGGDGKAYLDLNTPNKTLNMPGVGISGLSTLQAEEVTVSSINNSVYPPVFPQQAVTIAPNNILTYVKGGSDASLFLLPSQTAQHSYRIEFPVKIQGWNATDGLTPSYAPAAEDWITFYPQGNVVGSPAPVFNTLQMSMISSINNDWEGTISGVWKTTANGAETIQAATAASVGYSTSVEIGAFGYVTDLGAI
jgi:hypothetical protein